MNTIYCGDYDQGVRENWKDGATCSNGAYFNINSNEKVAFIQTPYDDEINNRNRQLNGTYLWYGSDGYVKKHNRKEKIIIPVLKELVLRRNVRLQNLKQITKTKVMIYLMLFKRTLRSY